jgi:hypothetical protein
MSLCGLRRTFGSLSDRESREATARDGCFVANRSDIDIFLYDHGLQSRRGKLNVSPDTSILCRI